ncbi:MAG: AI-2E family transporter [Planctomycetota bacterium]
MSPERSENNEQASAEASESGIGWLGVLLIAGALFLAGYAVFAYASVFGPLFAALGLAYALEPFVRMLERKKMKRRVAVGIVFLGALVVLGGGLWLAVSQIYSLLGGMIGQTGSTNIVAKSVANWSNMIQRLAAELDLQDRVKDASFWQPIVKPLATTMTDLLSSVLAGLSWIGVLILTPVYTLYLMVDMPRIEQLLRDHIPRADRERTDRVLGRVHVGLSAFLRGRILIAVLKGAILAVGLWIVGVPYPSALGLLAGLLSILPIIGPFLGWAFAIGVALADREGWLGFGLVTGVFLVAEALENFLLMPRVMKAGVDLHPLTVLFCVVFWGAVLGGLGALLAIPLTLCLKIAHEEYLLPEIRRLA